MSERIQVPYLEFNVLSHCNLRCAHCSQSAPHNPVWLADLDTFRRDVSRLAAVYHTARLRFLGGEPLLNKSLLEFIEAAREEGIAELLGVCSNGTVIRRMGDDFFQAIDFLDLSWYARSGTEETLDWVASECRTHGVKLTVTQFGADSWGIGQLDQRIEDEGLVKRIYDACYMAHDGHCHTFHRGRYYKCSQVVFMKNYLQKCGTRAPDFLALDGVALDSHTLKEDLRAYRGSWRPLQACHYCLGSSGKRVRWRELEQGEVERPMLEVEGDVRKLLDAAKLRRGRLNRLRRLPVVGRLLSRF